MKRRHKIVVAIVGTIGSLFVLAAVLLPLVIDADRLRPRAEAKLEAVLGRHVSLGELTVSLWTGPALRASRLRIGEPVSGPADPTVIVEAGPASVRLAWLPLLGRRIEARSIAIEGVRVSLGAKPLVSDLRLSSRLRIADDNAVAVSGSLEGVVAALSAKPGLLASFEATFVRGTLELAALDAGVGPVRVEAAGRATDVFSEAPRLTVHGSAKLKRSEVRGRFDAVLAAQPEANFELDSPLLDADEIIAIAGRSRGPAAGPRAASWLVPAASAAESGAAAGEPSFARLLVASGTVRADRCVVRGVEMTALSTRVSLDRGLAELHDIAFAIHGGKARGSLSLRPFEPRLPFSIDQAVEGMAIRPLIAALAPAQAETIEGTASLAVRMSGEAGGVALLPTMNGAGQLALENGKIASFGVIEQVLRTLEVAGAKGMAKAETPFDRLSAHFELAQGTAATKDLEFRSHDVDGDGAGTVGPGGAVKLDVLASFSKSVSADLVAKTQALSIRQGADGRLSVPLQIRGTIRDPRVQIDLDRVLSEGVLKQLKKKEGTKNLLKRLLGR